MRAWFALPCLLTLFACGGSQSNGSGKPCSDTSECSEDELCIASLEQDSEGGAWVQDSEGGSCLRPGEGCWSEVENGRLSDGVMCAE